jgi:hypothetical protein
VDEFFYSLTGERFSISTVHRKKSAVSPPLPIGFRAQLYDAETQLLLFSPSASLPASRPLDTFIGRFMSHHFDESEIGFDWLRPEMLADPFGLWEATTPVDGDQSWNEGNGFYAIIVDSLSPFSAAAHFRSTSAQARLHGR